MLVRGTVAQYISNEICGSRGRHYYNESLLEGYAVYLNSFFLFNGAISVHLHLLPKLMSGAVPQFPLYAFMACTGTTPAMFQCFRLFVCRIIE
jgi:hypothetical protein